jgi:hypothetical protein
MRARANSGDVVIALSPRERVLLGQVVTLLERAGTDDTDPAYAVLNRRAHPDDAEASAEFTALARDELDLQRERDRAVVAAIADGRTRLVREEAVGAMRSLNAARLVLASRAGVFDVGPGWEDGIADDPELAAVAWLASIQSALLGALTSGG